MECYIYGLVDPRTNKLRYVGKTSVGLAGVRKRYYRHMGDATDPKVDTHKSRWLAQLVDLSLKPTIVIIESGNWSAEEVCRREIEVIKYQRARGVDLTNTTDGGDGMRGVKLPPEQVAEQVKRLVAANTGRKRTEQARANFRLAWETRDRTVSEEVRAKHRANWADGKCPLTDEGRKKISESSKNRKQSEETKRKLSEAAKRRYANRTPEQIAADSELARQRVSVKDTCSVCGLEGTKSNITRHLRIKHGIVKS